MGAIRRRRTGWTDMERPGLTGNESARWIENLARTNTFDPAGTVISEVADVRASMPLLLDETW